MHLPSIEDAILLAVEAHRGQKDKAGLPYITHPLRVMGMFVLPAEDNERMLAVMHDVVENTNVTFPQLIDQGYPEVVLEALFAITRDSETYEEYIQRVGRNRLATVVKLADLRDNLNPHRASTILLPVATLEKYSAARSYLFERKTRTAP